MSDNRLYKVSDTDNVVTPRLADHLAKLYGRGSGSSAENDAEKQRKRQEATETANALLRRVSMAQIMPESELRNAFGGKTEGITLEEVWRVFNRIGLKVVPDAEIGGKFRYRIPPNEVPGSYTYPADVEEEEGEEVVEEGEGENPTEEGVEADDGADGAGVEDGSGDQKHPEEGRIWTDLGLQYTFDPTRVSMAQVGFYRQLNLEAESCEPIRRYKKHLERGLPLNVRAGSEGVKAAATGQITSNVNDVLRFCYFVMSNGFTKEDVSDFSLAQLLAPDSLELVYVWLDGLSRAGLGHEGLKNKSKHLKEFFRFVQTDPNIHKGCRELIPSFELAVELHASKISKSTRAEHMTPARQVADPTCKSLADCLAHKDTAAWADVVQSLKECDELLAGFDGNDLGSAELLKKLHSFACLYMQSVFSVDQGKRTGVLENMTVDEYMLCHEENQRYHGIRAIFVLSHKTAPDPAPVCLSDEEFQVFEMYRMYIRPRLAKDWCHQFLVNLKGERYHNDLSKLWRKNLGKLIYPGCPEKSFALGEVRHAIERASRQTSFSQDEARRTAVSRYLNHEVTTALRTYNRRTVEETVRARETMDVLFSQAVSQQPVPPMAIPHHLPEQSSSQAVGDTSPPPAAQTPTAARHSPKKDHEATKMPPVSFPWARSLMAVPEFDWDAFPLKEHLHHSVNMPSKEVIVRHFFNPGKVSNKLYKKVRDLVERCRKFTFAQQVAKEMFDQRQGLDNDSIDANASTFGGQGFFNDRGPGAKEDIRDAVKRAYKFIKDGGVLIDPFEEAQRQCSPSQGEQTRASAEQAELAEQASSAGVVPTEGFSPRSEEARLLGVEWAEKSPSLVALFTLFGRINHDQVTDASPRYVQLDEDRRKVALASALERFSEVMDEKQKQHREQQKRGNPPDNLVQDKRNALRLLRNIPIALQWLETGEIDFGGVTSPPAKRRRMEVEEEEQGIMVTAATSSTPPTVEVPLVEAEVVPGFDFETFVKEQVGTNWRTNHPAKTLRSYFDKQPSKEQLVKADALVDARRRQLFADHVVGRTEPSDVVDQIVKRCDEIGGTWFVNMGEEGRSEVVNRVRAQHLSASQASKLSPVLVAKATPRTRKVARLKESGTLADKVEDNEDLYNKIANHDWPVYVGVCDVPEIGKGVRAAEDLPAHTDVCSYLGYKTVPKDEYDQMLLYPPPDFDVEQESAYAQEYKPYGSTGDVVILAGKPELNKGLGHLVNHTPHYIGPMHRKKAKKNCANVDFFTRDIEVPSPQGQQRRRTVETYIIATTTRFVHKDEELLRTYGGVYTFGKGVEVICPKCKSA